MSLLQQVEADEMQPAYKQLCRVFAHIYRSKYRFIQCWGSKSSAPSPFICAVYLHQLDDHISTHAQQHGLHHYRLTDDWILLHTACELRTRVCQNSPNKWFVMGHFHSHNIARGFDLLVSRVDETAAQNVGLAQQSWGNQDDTHLGAFLEQCIEPSRWWV